MVKQIKAPGIKKTQQVIKNAPTKKGMFNYRIINKYYKTLDRKQIKTMIDINNGKSKISLRLLDWFVTEYAKKYDIGYNRNDMNEKNNDASDNRIESHFDIHTNYKTQLKSNSKKYFDPFRRSDKFIYYFDKEKTLTSCTTPGQLNFFKWAFSNGVINYIDANYSTIIKAMRKHNIFTAK
jgi:hypothetical protein